MGEDGTQRNLTLKDGDSVVSNVLKQGDNVQIYLPRAAIRYLGVEPGDQIRVLAIGGEVIVRRVAASKAEAPTLIIPPKKHVARVIKDHRAFVKQYVANTARRKCNV